MRIDQGRGAPLELWIGSLTETAAVDEQVIKFVSFSIVCHQFFNLCFATSYSAEASNISSASRAAQATIRSRAP